VSSGARNWPTLGAPDIPPDEAWQPAPIGLPGRLGEEGREVSLDDPVEDGVRRPPGLIARRHGTRRRHGPAREHGPCLRPTEGGGGGMSRTDGAGPPVGAPRRTGSADAPRGAGCRESERLHDKALWAGERRSGTSAQMGHRGVEADLTPARAAWMVEEVGKALVTVLAGSAGGRPRPRTLPRVTRFPSSRYNPTSGGVTG
jgi:hypothetical protein